MRCPGRGLGSVADRAPDPSLQRSFLAWTRVVEAREDGERIARR